MTNEEKAKAYDEALERAKKMMDSPRTCFDIEQLKSIFPELRESEDERTKRMLNTISYKISQHQPDIFTEEENEWFDAWLEKQKINTEGDFGRGYDCGYQAGYAVAMNEMKPKVVTVTLDSEKQKKSTDESDMIAAAYQLGLADGRKQKEHIVNAGKTSENTSASTMIPSCHEELTEFELVLFNAVLDNNFVGAKGSENALTMTKKIAPALLAIAKKEQDWNKKPCLTCQEYDLGFERGREEGVTAGYNKAMKEIEQKEQKPIKVIYIPKFRSEDKIVSTKNPHLTYIIRKTGVMDESGELCYECEILADGKSDNDIKLLSIEKVDSWGELIEQKPADQPFEEWLDDWYQDAKDAEGHIVMTKWEFKNWSRGIRNMFEQKPVEKAEGWSMKDAHFHSNLLYLMRENDSKEGWEGCYEWLEELPLRIPLQSKPVEWSEEDEKIIETLIRELRLNAQFEFAVRKLGLDYVQTLTVLDKCRRLQPIPSWKPSEEQIEALKEALETYKGFEEYDAMKSLHNDLNKLMEGEK